MGIPLVSVLLLTCNGADTLPGVLSAVRAQHAAVPIEVVAVDSGSRDGTAAFLRDRVDRLIEIPRAEFNHGTTRNLGIEACRGPLVVLLAQDAEPASASWLDRLVAPLAEPGPLAGTCARQLPRALALSVAMPLGPYLGAKSADAGRELLRAEGV